MIALRPEHGLSASRWRELIGVRLPRAVAAFDAFRLDDLDDADHAAGEADVEKRA